MILDLDMVNSSLIIGTSTGNWRTTATTSNGRGADKV